MISLKLRICILSIVCSLLLGAWSIAYAVDGITLNPASTLYNARALGMGGVSVAYANDASGVFANPAATAGLEFPQVLAASRKLVLDETQYTLFSWALPTDFGTFGLGYTSLNTADSLPTQRDPATERILLDPSREATSFDNSAVAISYSRQLNEMILVGGNYKFFNQSFSGGVKQSVQTTGLDLGVVFKPFSWLTAAANMQNLLEGSLAWSATAKDKVGGVYKLGSKVNILGSTAEAMLYHQQSLSAGFDLDIPHSSLASSAYHLGAEYMPLKYIALRAGLNMEGTEAGMTFGVGFINGGFRFDYAFLQRPGIPGDNPHYFSLSYIGERVKTKSYKLKDKEAAITWYNPKDRTISDRSDIKIKALVQEKRILDETTTWTVTGVSATSEVNDVDKYANLPTVYLNGIKIDQVGTIESSSPLAMGRNVFEITAYSTPEMMVGRASLEVFAASSEARVLRFKPFTDTPMTFWAIRPIALAVTLGVVKGYPDDTFRPDKGITRAELVTLLVRTMPVRLAATVPYSGFDDVSNKHWAAKYIAYGSHKGLITGYPDGTFKPNKVLTRAEGVTVLARYSNLAILPAKKPPFPDLQPDFWANKYIAAAKKEGMLQYLVGKNFEPTTPFTRAEATEVLYRTPMIQRAIDQFWDTGALSTEQSRTPLKPETEIVMPVETPAPTVEAQ